jgi:PAS domain-containing protein
LHTVLHASAMFFLWLTSAATLLAAKLAAIAGRAPTSNDFIISAIIVTSLAIPIISGLWIIGERARFMGFRQWIRVSVTRAQSALLLRDAIIAASGEAVAVLGSHLSGPLSFGGGNDLLQLCLAGPDALTLKSALNMLQAKSAAFSQKLRTADGQYMAVRGRPVGGHAVLYMRRMAPITDCQSENRAALRLQPCGGVAGTVTDASNNARPTESGASQRDVFKGFISQMTTAIAVFGSKRQLVSYNSAYAELWGLSETWLDTQPSETDILDHLREAKRLPERRDYQAWKRELLQLFERADPRRDELWHLSDGQSLRVVTRPYPGGGIIYIFENVTDSLRLESAYNSLAKVQVAMLNSLRDGVAIFGTDGRLKVHNRNFARQWDLSDLDLANQPHASQIAEMCQRQFGCGRLWEILVVSINSNTPEEYNDWATITRPDGKAISLTLTRLPDGSTMATYLVTTSALRIEAVAEHAA